MTTDRPNRRGRKRAGATMVEMVVAAAVFGSLLLTIVPLTATVSRQQRNVDRQRLAVREADNLLESLSLLPWNELTPDRLAELKLSDTAQAHLPHGKLVVEVTESAEPPASKRVVARVTWIPQAGRPTQSVRVTAWFFATEVRP